MLAAGSWAELVSFNRMPPPPKKNPSVSCADPSVTHFYPPNTVAQIFDNPHVKWLSCLKALEVEGNVAFKGSRLNLGLGIRSKESH